jgi:hypothetical protein
MLMILSILLLIMWSLAYPRVRRGSVAHVTAAVTLTLPAPRSMRPPTRGWHQFTVAPRAPLDLFGNPVNSAVATYQIDDTGTLYEVHSPQTEVPRLGSPIS